MSDAAAFARIVQERVIDAPPSDVFAAWSDAAGMQAWMCPAPTMTHATVAIDFRVGGAFRIVMHGDRDYAHHGEYLVIDPPRRLVFTWVSEWLPDAESATRVSLTLAPVDGDRTLLTLVHDELPVPETYRGHVEGWATILDKLAAQLAASKEPS